MCRQCRHECRGVVFECLRPLLGLGRFCPMLGEGQVLICHRSGTLVMSNWLLRCQSFGGSDVSVWAERCSGCSPVPGLCLTERNGVCRCLVGCVGFARFKCVVASRLSVLDIFRCGRGRMFRTRRRDRLAGTTSALHPRSRRCVRVTGWCC